MFRRRRTSPEEQAAIEAERERAVLEAAAEYIIGIMRDDQEMIDRAMEPGEETYLMWGVITIANRALEELAAERGVDRETLVRTFRDEPHAPRDTSQWE